MQLQSSARFRESGQSGGRRRRVLTDALSGGSSEGHPKRRSRLGSGIGQERVEHKSPHYGEAAFLDHQPRLTDLVPQRLLTLGLIFLLGMALIAGVELLYAWMPALAPLLQNHRIAAFDLAAAGSLCTWLCSFLLQVAGVVSILIYRIRRHRLDDYHGHYRVWLWAALCCFLMSIDEGAQLHDGFKDMMILVTGMRFLGDGSIWWVTTYFFLLGSIGLRLLLDMRESRFSCLLLVLAGAAYGFSAAVHLNWLAVDAWTRQPMAEAGGEMVGGLLLVLTMFWHVRHLIFDAEGRLPRRAREPAEPAEPPPELEKAKHEPETAGDTNIQMPVKRQTSIDAAHSVPQPAAIFKPSAPAPSPPAPIPPAEPKLTKAERKALRKRLDEMRKAREAQERGKKR